MRGLDLSSELLKFFVRFLDVSEFSGLPLEIGGMKNIRLPPSMGN